MGFKMKHGPISMKGSPALVDQPVPKKLEVVDLVAKGKADRAARKIQARTDYANQKDPFKKTEAYHNLSYNERQDVIAGKRAQLQGRGKSQAFDEFVKVKKPTLTFPEQPKIKIDPVTNSNSTVTPKAKPTKTNKRSYKEAYAKRDMNTYGNLTQAEYTAEAKRQKGGGKVPGSQMKGSLNSTPKKKTTTSNNSGDSNNYTKNINNKTQKRKEAEAKYLKSTDSKAPKVDKVLSKRELRLENVKRKAANEKAKTNKTAQSIDASKPTSADTGAKQTSARSSRRKAKRLENRAIRIQGRIDRKGKSSAEKRASRKATRQKVRKNR